MHRVYPHKFCTTIISDFFWYHCYTMEKLGAMVMQNLRGGRGGGGEVAVKMVNRKNEKA